MSFEYISDIFGRFRKNRKTRFTDVEKKAKELLKAHVSGTISDKDFAQKFHNVGTEFRLLCEVDGQTTIDEDTPLWLNQLYGLHFIKWLQWQQVKWYFEAHPDELAGQKKEQFTRLQEMSFDENFLSVCKTTLQELDK